MHEFRLFIADLKKNPLSTMLGAAIVAIGYLVIFIKAEIAHHSEQMEAARRELVDTERRCAQEIDAIRKEQNSDLRVAIDRQTKIEERLARLTKKGK
jgi:uncharacterized protein involved in exopolysaccharide biosynthesis